MTVADWVIVAIIGLSVLIGVWRGLIREAMSLVVWLAAIVAAMLFGHQVATLFEAWIELPSARIALGHVSVFLLVLIVGSLLTWAVGQAVRSSGLSGTDRLFGLGFGLLRGIAIIAALVLVLGYTPLPQDPWWRQSQLIPRFEPAAQWLREQLPQTAQMLQELRSEPVQPDPGNELPAAATPPESN
ncbi:MAG: CvpA family protein [Xanthomonadales bacterium]|nr:CvpA family protein [Xanthomonadales bacterium]